MARHLPSALPVRLASAWLLGAACLVAAPPARGQALPPPVTPGDFEPVAPAVARLGQLLFYDPILSGNRNISCGTCHHHDLAGADGLSLGIGEGGFGIGPQRRPGTGPGRVRARIPRNAPALWNLGHREIRVLFHDGRLEHGRRPSDGAYEKVVISPAADHLPEGLTGLLAAQALFPVTSAHEMAGDPGENEVADAVAQAPHLAWPVLAARIRALPGYLPLFEDAFAHVTAPEDITMVEIANAIGGFVASEWQSFDSPFDAYLAGDASALTSEAKRGMELFFGEAGCAACHSGPLFSDQSFHAIGLPDFGPGKPDAEYAGGRDLGRGLLADHAEAAYRFRTPMLRNVALTAPYGHNGAYPTLEGIIRQHCTPQETLSQWRPRDAGLPEIPWLAAADFPLQADEEELARRSEAIDITPMPGVTDDEIAALVAFLESLTGATAETRPLGRPGRVPSGLPVD